ncbi:hypothetical protein FB567DRAFT_532145 [Paraphoma chrysanthemicola]|uniref:SRR1-like domain-containing protein n=1 Tax=Paraphoma chrysanthemicola TaxID=798071 RepID=A0A8K0R027_9PLEO|nr:hypothetical protein FB567DRAFT_532145 [Paraphoma chrysanthemicola]
MSLRSSSVRYVTDTCNQHTKEPYHAMEPVIQLQPILAAQAKHGPIFRRELFDVAYAAYKSIDEGDANEIAHRKLDSSSFFTDQEVLLHDLWGNEHPKSILREGIETREDDVIRHKRNWLYNSLQRLGRAYGHNSAKDKRYTLSLLPFDFGTRSFPIEEHNPSVETVPQETLNQWAAQWETSELRSRLSSFFQGEARRQLQHIDQIICFGLGRPLEVSPWPAAACRAYQQHLAACTIRDLIAHTPGCTAPTVFAQDPEYSAAEKTYLSEQLNINVLDDPEGFKALTGNTFVITVSPNVAVRQISVDMTHEDGGPAGFLCQEIISDGLECDGVGLRDAKDWKSCLYSTCPPSPALWEYKQKSIRMEYDDTDGLGAFGKMGVYMKSPD